MWTRGFLALCAIAVVSARTINSEDELTETTFANEIGKWALHDEETELFKEIIEFLRMPTELHRSDWRAFPAARHSAICLVCRSTARQFIKLRRLGLSEEKIRTKVIKLCTLLNLQTENVCRGVVELNLPTILYIVDNKPDLSANTVCGVLLESNSCPITDPEAQWTVNVDDGPVQHVVHRDSPTPSKVLQISDLHYDPKYEPFGNALCDEPTCCRQGQNSSNISKTVAGYWGDYNYCDTPWHAVVDAFQHIRETHTDLDVVYFTGDIIDHGVWETSKEGNTESIIKSYNEIHATFGDIPVYPILGNHEPHPLNLFAPKSVSQDDLSTEWLYKLIADIWISKGWLPESTRSTIHQGGYYTVVPKKGFRIIALNSNVCYCYNWWLWFNMRDPDNQLQWFADTLLEAERNGEFVHILSHIPTQSKHCFSTWRKEYIRIVSRFSHIITAQFNGHTHNDEIQVFYDDTEQPKNLAWNGGSLTTYQNLNLNYKVYSVNGNDFSVIDYENWIYNLTEANLAPHLRPRWFKSYSFKEEYGIKEVTPKTMGDWLSVAVNDDNLRNKYYRNFYKHAQPSLASSCDVQCKQEYICRIITSMDADSICTNILV